MITEVNDMLDDEIKKKKTIIVVVVGNELSIVELWGNKSNLLQHVCGMHE